MLDFLLLLQKNINKVGLGSPDYLILHRIQKDIFKSLYHTGIFSEKIKYTVQPFIDVLHLPYYYQIIYYIDFGTNLELRFRIQRFRAVYINSRVVLKYETPCHQFKRVGVCVFCLL